MEDRARQAGAEEHYGIVYRNFSRNVHGSDFNELMLVNDPSMLEEHRAGLFEARDGIALDVAFIALYLVADRVDRGFGLGQSDQLTRLVETRRRQWRRRRA